MKRDQKPGPDVIPNGYEPQPGDEWVRVIDLRREHQGRVFEARSADGSGIRGPLIDVQWHMLHSFMFLYFRDVPKPVRSGVEGWLLMKPEGWQEPDQE